LVYQLLENRNKWYYSVVLLSWPNGLRSLIRYADWEGRHYNYHMVANPCQTLK
jgi:hypothetical protein